MTHRTIQLKKEVFDMLPEAKSIFIHHHPDWEMEAISNSKIVYEALKFYIKTG